MAQVAMVLQNNIIRPMDMYHLNFPLKLTYGNFSAGQQSFDLHGLVKPLCATKYKGLMLKKEKKQ